MWGPAGDGVPSDVIPSAVVRTWSVMRSQGYAADVYELPGCRNAHQCLYTSTMGKSPLHPLARIRILLSPIGTRNIQLDLQPFVRRAGSSQTLRHAPPCGGEVHACTLGVCRTTRPIGKNVMRYVAIPFSP